MSGNFAVVREMTVKEFCKSIIRTDNVIAVFRVAPFFDSGCIVGKGIAGIVEH